MVPSKLPNQEVGERPQSTCSKVVEQLKKNGEFDKYRREVVDKITKSEDVQILLDQCKEIVEKALASTTDLQRCEIGRLREFVKNELKRRRLVDGALNSSLPQCLNEVGVKLNEKIEEFVRTEFGIVRPAETKLEVVDADMEPIDMEVSSGTEGGSSASNASSKSCSSNVVSKKTSSSANSRKKSDPGTKFLENDPGEGDDNDLLERFADSLSSSARTSSLSCNASDESSQAQSPMESDTKTVSSQTSKSDKSTSERETLNGKTISGEQK